jgi:hypothetical protein
VFNKKSRALRGFFMCFRCSLRSIYALLRFSWKPLRNSPTAVIPAKAGIQGLCQLKTYRREIPAYAGMTGFADVSFLLEKMHKTARWI